MALVIVNTHWGPYLGDDSYYYIYPAQDVLAGKGFNPSYIFGPMFPLVLTGLSLTGLNIFTAVRWLNAILFGVNIFLVGSITRRFNVPAGFSLVAAALVLLSDVTAEAHGAAMSEALAFTFMLLSLAFCLDFLTGHKRRYWWGAAIAAGLAVLTRYASIPLIGAIGLALFIFPPGKRFIQRIKDAVLFGLLGLAPVALYWLRNEITAGHPVRYLSFSLVSFGQEQLARLMYDWFSLFIPGRFLRGREIPAGVVLIIAGLMIVAVLARLYRKKLAQTSDPTSRAGLFLLTGVVVLNFAMLYIAHGLTELDVLNPRYLVPILIAFIILLAGSLGLLWKASSNLWMRAAIIGFFAVFVVYYGFRTVDFSRQVFRTGSGYLNIGWRNSETIAYIEAHPDLTKMVSTGEMGIYFWTQRMPITLAAYPTPEALRDYLCQTGAPLFIMNQMPTELYGLSHDQVVDALKLVKTFNDGQMYGCPTK